MSDKQCNYCNSYIDADHIVNCEYPRLKNALRHYGTHKSDCKSRWMTTRAESITRGECTCGLENILKLYEKTT